mmetsp:Transcript_5983/g.22705  ORF Transcript_5983/g.22705 Transcript_5983/m.22705 type:complete len:273 (+) Transcript_5983:100-918(+)
MAQANGIGKPEQKTMGGDKVQQLFGDKNGLLVKQTRRGCRQECLGCEAKSEYKISAMEWNLIYDDYKVSEEGKQQQDIMYALEKSNYCCRRCWRDGRPFNMKVSEGGQPGGAEVLQYIKPCSFPLYFSIPTQNGSIDCPCCCLLPKLSTSSANGTPLENQSKYICDINLAVPKLQYLEKGNPVYILKPETCCGGCCIVCNPCTGKGLGSTFLSTSTTPASGVSSAATTAARRRLRSASCGQAWGRSAAPPRTLSRSCSHPASMRSARRACWV